MVSPSSTPVASGIPVLQPRLGSFLTVCLDCFWVDDLERKIDDELHFDMTIATGERKIQEALEDWYKDKVIEEQVNQRYKCDLCGKMFKSDVFVQNHLQNKHEKECKEVKDKVRPKSKLLELKPAVKLPNRFALSSTVARHV